MKSKEEMSYKNNTTRKIKEALYIQSGEYFNSDIFFRKSRKELIQIRRELEDSYSLKKKYIVCPECLEYLNIRGLNGSRILHFSHYKNSKECSLKLQGLSKEEILKRRYANVVESELHKYLKNIIAELISKDDNFDSKTIKVDKWYKADDYKFTNSYRLPDVHAVYKQKKIAFEIQLSSTFLSVIRDREEFYKNNSVYIIWIFSSFDKNETARKLMEEDIYYLNKNNVFVLNEEMIEKSKKNNTLILQCNYLDKNNFWQEEEVFFKDLKYDKLNYKLYYHDNRASLSKEYERIWFENKDIEQSYLVLENRFIEEGVCRAYDNNNEKACAKAILKALYSLRYKKIKEIFNLDNIKSLTSHMLNSYNRMDESRKEKYYMKLCLVLYFEALAMMEKVKEIEDDNLQRKQKIEEFKKTMYQDITVEKIENLYQFKDFFKVLFPKLILKI